MVQGLMLRDPNGPRMENILYKNSLDCIVTKKQTQLLRKLQVDRYSRAGATVPRPSILARILFAKSSYES